MSTESEPFMERRGVDSLREAGVGDLVKAVAMLAMAVWTKTSRRMRMLALFVGIM